MLLAFLCSDVVFLMERASARFYQMVCIYKHSVLFFLFFSQHATHSSAFLVHLAVLSVGGRKRERREKGRESESVSNGSWPWWFQANAFQGQRWHESSRSNLAWRNKTGFDWTHGLIHLIPKERMKRFCWRLAPPCDRISFQHCLSDTVFSL